MSTEPDQLRVERPLAGCVVVTLDRPAAMNALSGALRRQIVACFRALQADVGTRVVVLTGAGRAFCAGLDLRELAHAAHPSEAVVPDADADPVAAVEAFRGPVIGAINGAAITGGFELALACDVLLASEQAVFADTHARVGVLPGWGLSQKLSRRLGPARAKELAFTGNFLPAVRAEAWGLVNRVLPAQALLPAALDLARDMLSTDGPTLEAYKRLIDEGYEHDFGAARRLERERSGVWAQTLGEATLAGRGEAVRRRGRLQAGTEPGEDG